MNQEAILMEAPVIASSPHSFIEIPRLWLRVYHMDNAFLDAERPRASSTNTLLGVLSVTATLVLLSMVSALLQARADPVNAAPVLLGGLASALFSGIGNLVGFYVINGMVLLGARIFGGQGDYGSQAYLYSLVAVPVTVMVALFMFFASLLTQSYTSASVSFPLSIYALIVWVRVVKVSHKLSTWAAIGAVVIPLIVLWMLVSCSVAGVSLIAGLVGGAVLEMPGSVPY